MNAPAISHVGHGQRRWLYALVGLAAVLLVAPSILVVIMSFTASTFLEFPPRAYSLRWYRAYLDSPAWQEATYVSVITACWTVALATPIGVAAAYGLHALGLRVRRALLGILMLPLLVPHILIAVGLFFAYVQIGLLNTIPGLVAAHTLLALPLVVAVVLAGLSGFDVNQERVARSMGASRLLAFLKVTLPQIRFSVVSAALFAFITSFDEGIVALFVATGETSTLTRRMFLALRDSIDPTIAAISTGLIVISVVVVTLTQIWGGRRAD